MSDLKLFNTKTLRLIKKQAAENYDIRNIILNHASELLGVTIIATAVPVNSAHNEIIDILGYDENNQIVIIEFREGRYSPVIGKGLMCIDHIIAGPSRLKIMLNEKLGYEQSTRLSLHPRLISIGNDYNQYDEYAIKQTPYMIDLIKYQFFKGNMLLLEKLYQSKKIFTTNTAFKKNELLNMISNFMLSLGDEVCEVGFGYGYSYRKIKNFAHVMFKNDIELHILKEDTFKPYIIKSEKSFEKLQKEIEYAYSSG